MVYLSTLAMGHTAFNGKIGEERIVKDIERSGHD
jgi:hypothetical protein